MMSLFYINGNKIWKKETIIKAAEGLKSFDFTITYDILKSPTIWRFTNLEDVALHLRQCLSVNISTPIVLDPDGNIIDGFHRIIKAIISNITIISAVQLIKMPPPDLIL